MKIPAKWPIDSRIVGVTYGKRQAVIANLRNGDPLMLKPEPGNRFDPKALAVVTERGEHVGYIPRDYPLRDQMLDILNNRTGIINCVASGKRGGRGYSYGLDVRFYVLYGEQLVAGAVDKEEPQITRSKPKLPNTEQKAKRPGKEYRDVLVKRKRHHPERFTYQEIEAMKERRSA